MSLVFCLLCTSETVFIAEEEKDSNYKDSGRECKRYNKCSNGDIITALCFSSDQHFIIVWSRKAHSGERLNVSHLSILISLYKHDK